MDEAQKHWMDKSHKLRDDIIREKMSIKEMDYEIRKNQEKLDELLGKEKPKKSEENKKDVKDDKETEEKEELENIEVSR